MSLSDFLEAQSDSGRLDSSGTFSIDFAKARDKLRLFSLPFTTDYLLKLTQFANLVQAERLAWNITTRAVQMSLFTSRPLKITLRDISQRLLNPVTEITEPDLKCLLVGLNGALAMQPQQLSIQDARGHHLTLESDLVLLQEDTEDEEEALPSPEDGAAFTFTLHRKRDRRQSLQETLVIKERCHLSIVPILLNGEPLQPRIPIYEKLDGSERYLPQEFVLGERRLYAEKGFPVPPWPSHPGDARDPKRKVFLRQRRGEEHHTRCRQWIMLRYGLKANACLHYWQHGVIVDTQYHNLGVPGLEAVLDASDLNTDLSGLQVQEDQTSRKVLKTAGQELRQDVRSSLHKLYATVAPSVKDGESDRSLNCLGCLVAVPASWMLSGLLATFVPAHHASRGWDVILCLVLFFVLLLVLKQLTQKLLLSSRFLTAPHWKRSDRNLRAYLEGAFANGTSGFPGNHGPI